MKSSSRTMIPKACWQLSLENLLGGDGDTRYEMIHEPKCPLKC